jgi:hypothetical protein
MIGYKQIEIKGSGFFRVSRSSCRRIGHFLAAIDLKPCQKNIFLPLLRSIFLVINRVAIIPSIDGRL